MVEQRGWNPDRSTHSESVDVFHGDVHRPILLLFPFGKALQRVHGRLSRICMAAALLIGCEFDLQPRFALLAGLHTCVFDEICYGAFCGR